MSKNFHTNSIFGPGPRVPLDRERRAQRAARNQRRNQKNGTSDDVVTRFCSIEKIARRRPPAMKSTNATTALPPAIIVTEAARRLGITAPTAWALVDKKELAGFRLGARRFVTEKSLAALVDRIRAATAPAKEAA